MIESSNRFLAPEKNGVCVSVSMLFPVHHLLLSSGVLHPTSLRVSSELVLQLAEVVVVVDEVLLLNPVVEL